MTYGTLRVDGRDLDVTALRLVGGRLQVTARGCGPMLDPGPADLLGDDGRLVFRVAALDLSADDRQQLRTADTVTIVLPLGFLQP